MKKLLLLALCLLISACAARAPRVETGETDTVWGKMQATSHAAAGPYRLQLSMRFGEEGNTRRVTGVLWGNDSRNLRLDVMAGVGAILAKIQESPDAFILYAPRENRAYRHTGPQRPMLKIGIPVPFDLQSLAELLNGRFAQVFGDAYLTANADGSGASYEIDGPLAGELVLDAAGAPVAWKQAGGAWTLKLAYNENEPLKPKSLKLANINGQQAIIMVKQRETPEPFDPSQLELAIPPGTVTLPLSRYRPS